MICRDTPTHTPTHGWLGGSVGFDLTPPIDPLTHPLTHPWVGVSLQIINLQTELNLSQLAQDLYNC